MEQGRGEKILFVHGWGGSINSFKTISDALSKKYLTINLSLPGFGNSDLPEKNWGTAEYADCIVCFLQQLKIKKIIYVGHSFGGSLGIYLASTFPDLISKLVLIAPSYKRTALAQSQPSILNQIFSKIPAGKTIRRILYRTLYPKSDIWKYPQLESNFRKIITEDLTDRLNKIKAKTLIIWGVSDRETPISHVFELEKAVTTSKLVTVPNASHGLPLQNPDILTQEINTFLNT